MLGPYEILAPIGAGAMGEVYRARDTRLGRAVAIKVLPDRLASDPQARSRFEREAQMVAALSHPNILAIHDYGSEGGIFFAVTELLEGETLRHRIKEGSLSVTKVVEIGTAVAEGLAAAHSKRIVHRDLKPENIFLTSEGGVKILDFGLATRKPGPDTQDVTLSDAGRILGTVGYMSPEQVRGLIADTSSDIFSMGCILFEMATGQRAFSRSTAAETMTAILREDPPDVLGSGSHFPVDLAHLVARCLEKNPQKRFQSARDLAFALKSMSSGAASLPLAVRPQRRFHPPPWLISALYKLTGRRRSINSLAVLPFVNAGGDPGSDYLGDGIAESLINSLSQLAKLRVVPRGKAFRFRNRDADAEEVGRQLNVRAVLTGKVVERGENLIIQVDLVDVLTDSQLWGHRYQGRLSEILTVQEEISQEVSTKLGLQPAAEDRGRLTRRYTQNTEAYQLYLKGRYYWNRRTAHTLKKAVDYFERALEKDSHYALAYAGLADCYVVYSSYLVLPPLEAYPKAEEAAQKALAIDESLAEPHAALAFSKGQYDRDWTGAEKEFQRAIELNPGYATAHQWYGNLLEATGRLDEALVEMTRAQELEPLSLIINALVGRTLYFRRQFDESIEQLQKTIEMEPNFATAHSYLGKVYQEKGLYPEAIAEFQAGLKLAPEDPQLLGCMGHIYAKLGKRAEALQKVNELLELSHRRYVWPFEIGLIYAGLDDMERAFEWMERAVEDHASPVFWLKVDPRVDSLRNNPRFRAMLEGMGLLAMSK
jgi:serine/threonine protein kinase/tetratricopeptide (TPR) repeat protein